MTHLVSVVLQTPAHSPLAGALSYRSALALVPGTLVRVPLGQRELLGVVWDPAGPPESAGVDPDKLRDVGAVLGGLPPLSAHWRQLVGFAAAYYQRALGEVALAALPPQLRALSEQQMQRRLRRKAAADVGTAPATAAEPAVTLSAEQQEVLAQLHAGTGCFLLFGTTGSGKTEVYLQCVQALLLQDPQAQVIVMVPEMRSSTSSCCCNSGENRIIAVSGR
jgi:primosomal protein N' (replication factor Y)